MIDVQARLKSTGRCFVSPADNIIVVTFAFDSPEGYRQGDSIWMGDSPEKTRWVSTDGYTLFWWSVGNQFRNNGKERYGPSEYERKRESWAGRPGWIPNETHTLKSVGYLLNVEEVQLNRSKGLDFDTHNGIWVKR